MQKSLRARLVAQLNRLRLDCKHNQGVQQEIAQAAAQVQQAIAAQRAQIAVLEELLKEPQPDEPPAPPANH